MSTATLPPATRATLARRLVGLSARLSHLHRSLPAALAAKADAYAIAYYDEISDGRPVTTAREYATIAASEHIANIGRIQGDIEAVAEELSLLRFLVEHGLVEGLEHDLAGVLDG